MVFEKASTRTRASFEIAMYELGGHALYLGMQGSQLERGEPIRDTARVLSGYCHGIMVRTFGHDRAEEMARYATVPVINGLTDLLHPCQVLADLQTVAAALRRAGGDVRATLRGGEVRLDRRRQQHGELVDRGGRDPRASTWRSPARRATSPTRACWRARAPPSAAGSPSCASRPQAVAGRQVISTDVFASMGQEEEAEARRQAFAGYCIDAALMAAADARARSCCTACPPTAARRSPTR